MIQLIIKPAQTEHLELLAALFSDLFNEGIQVTESAIHAYPSDEEWANDETLEVYKKYLTQFDCAATEERLPETNWNKEWESNYDPVQIEDLLTIQAPFHELKADDKPVIFIQPQMSFGTGHHATTAGMIKALSLLDLKGKHVMDAGTGTGILAIYTIMRGATDVLAFDIDETCAINTVENIALNPAIEGLGNRIQVEHNTLDRIAHSNFDIVIANINRNYLLDDAEALVSRLKSGGLILLSGFYDRDVKLVADRYMQCGTVAQYLLIKDEWACLTLIKPNKG